MVVRTYSREWNRIAMAERRTWRRRIRRATQVERREQFARAIRAVADFMAEHLTFSGFVNREYDSDFGRDWQRTQHRISKIYERPST